ADTLRSLYTKKETQAFNDTINERENEVVDFFENYHNAENEITKEQEEDNIDVEPEVLAENTEFLYNLLDDDDFNKGLDSNLLNDEEIKEAIDNSPIIHNVGDTIETVDENSRNEHFKMLIEKAKLDTFVELSKNPEFCSKTEEEKKSSLPDEVKMSFLSSLATIRTASQIMAESDGNEKTAQTQLEKLANGKYQEDATSYAVSDYADAKVVNIHSDVIIQACASSQKKAEKFCEKLKSLASGSSDEKKKHYEKAINCINSCKEKFQNGAKAIWNQRYEIAHNLQDSAPKIVTDVVATAALVGATIAGGSVLAPAVFAYGAYKATTSWMWPIVTEARKQARIQEKKYSKKRVNFATQLKEAAKSINSDKKKRKKYLKQAVWGTAAGIVGLGAAGVAAGTVGALAARSAQSISSMAIHSVNKVVETVGVLKDKEKSNLSKGITAAVGIFGTAVVGSIIASKLGLGDDAVNVSGDVAEATKGATRGIGENLGIKPDTAETTSSPFAADTLQAKQVAQNIEANAQEAEISCRTGQSGLGLENTSTVAYKGSADLWSEDTGITERQWERLRTIWDQTDNGTKEGKTAIEVYTEFYNRIPDTMLNEGGIFEGMTKEQVLFKYQRLASWNLTDHQETIKKLNKFFNCGESLNLNNNDFDVINSVTKTGAIKDVVGEGNNVVERLETGCNDGVVVINRTVVENVQEETIATNTSSNMFEHRGQGNNIYLTKDEEASATYNKGNSLDGEFVKNVEDNKINITAKNVKVLTETQERSSIEIGSGSKEENFNASSLTSQSSSNSVVLGSGSKEENFDIGTLASQSNANQESSSITLGSGSKEENFDESALTPQGKEADLSAASTFTNSEDQIVTTEIIDGKKVTTTTSYSVVEGVEDVNEGTRAAGNIVERGGYNYTGLTEKQYNATATFYKNRYGLDAYETFASRITDDMRSKGGVFEGLSVEQSMFAMKQIISWGYGETGQFNQEVDIMFDYLKGCSGTISVENSTQIKALVDRVCEDGSMIDITGNKPIMARHFEVGNCGETSNLVTEKAASGVTEDSGDTLNRLFMKPNTIVSTEPIFENLGKGKDINLSVDENLSINKLKGNTINDGSIIKENVSADEIDNIEAKNTDVLVRETRKGVNNGKIKIPTKGKGTNFAFTNQGNGIGY
ncbi:MAG: hypothetical protein IKW39_01635, partial [Alphaproteobacteria bacterium]|nr:hypothetical protein [Alphaproteobacteria bacterium]